jgi:MoxR-like ATPase
MVLATQNPIEQEGTYPLPEAQMDRFFLHLFVNHPSDENERKILRLVRKEEADEGATDIPEPVPQQILFDARKEVLAVTCGTAVEQYIVALISATRNPERGGADLKRWILVGASPRGTLALDRASRANAWLNGRNHVLPDDVREVAPACLRHRLILSYEANADGVTADMVIDKILKQVAVA